MKNSRQLALEILGTYSPGCSTVSVLLNDRLARVKDAPDKGFIRGLVWGAVRYANALDWAINRFLVKPQKLKPLVLDILRLGAYQILYEHQRIPAYAAVDESVGLARIAAPWASGLVNAVLRSLVRCRDTEGSVFPRDQFDTAARWLSISQAHPEWMVNRWLDRMGEEETSALCAANNSPALLTIRVNTLKVSRDAVMRELAAADVSAELCSRSSDGVIITERCELEKIQGYSDGHFVVQDEASQTVAHFLDPRAGETVLDVCCGSGIKTTHLAQITRNNSRICALDSDGDKIKRARALSAGMGATAVEYFPIDIRQFKERVFDKILIDAPCSGLGAIRRKPDIKWNRTAGDITARYPAMQAAILQSCAPLLADRGTMVYATCSTEPEENERIVEKFIDENPAFLLGETRRTWPHRDGIDGFFMAKLIKGTQ
ncbi:MAG: 16S rRNA (cytosine(967)-C(5))-methyltransferase RsmB [Elusimicrobia bacterium]|nr:16S rRNA (cytosine(967)-C(5))-methyltransferase RsmB [Elusimicrobiota bacterium]